MGRRSPCPVSCWLDIFGDKWTLLILRDVLFFNKRNYKDFVGSEEGISTNILADRLQKLVDNKVLIKSTNPTNKLVFDYKPTPKAMQLIPVLESMVRWSTSNLSDTYTIEDFNKMK